MDKNEFNDLMKNLEDNFDGLFDDLDDEFEDDGIIVLNDADGNEVEFEFLDLIEYEDENYIVLLPTEDSQDDSQVVILRVDGIDTEDEAYVSVEDTDVLQAVFEVFKEKFRDEFNFED